jgi:hypothetical protein
MRAPQSFWSTLWSQPPGPHSRLSRFVVANGLLYLAIGLGVCFAPTPVLLRVFFLDRLAGYEEGLARAVGLTLAVIGWLYAMGGRARSDSFALATVADRLLIPLFLAYLHRLGLPLGMVLPFAILDPLLAIATWWIWRRERAREALAPTG